MDAAGRDPSWRQRPSTLDRLSPRELEQYLYGAIPLSRAMQVSALEVTDEWVILAAPLAPNINHRGTVFGGSACTLATLAAWSLLHNRLRLAQSSASIVLQSSCMQHQRPIAEAFSARAELTLPAQWPVFRRTLERRGKARITLSARLLAGDTEAGLFSGEFVALA